MSKQKKDDTVEDCSHVSQAQVGINWGLFIVLLIFFFPAAIVYAVLKALRH